MTQTIQRRNRVKPNRTVRLTLGPSEVNPARVITIAVGDVHDDYMVLPFPSDFGTAFSVSKVGDPDQKVYSVNLNQGGTGGLCDCKGHAHRGTCRHVEALNALRRAGKL